MSDNFSQRQSRLNQAQQDESVFLDSNSGGSGVVASIINRVPQIRNATQFYAYDALRVARDAMGHIASNVKRQTYAQQQMALMAVKDREEAAKKKTYGLSRLGFRGDEEMSAEDEEVDPMNAFEEEEDTKSSKKTKKGSVSPPNDNIGCTTTTTTAALVAKIPSVTSTAASATLSAASKATAYLATGIYNILSSTVIPEVHYHPRRAAYGSAPTSVASYFGNHPYLIHNSGSSNNIGSPSSVAALNSALGHFIPPYGHASSAKRQGTNYEDLHQQQQLIMLGNTNNSSSDEKGGAKAKLPPPSFTVLSAAVQSIVVEHSRRWQKGGGEESEEKSLIGIPDVHDALACYLYRSQKDQRQQEPGENTMPKSFSSTNTTAVPSKVTYISLALQDGLAIFEVDSHGVYEVLAVLKGDAVLHSFLLHHALSKPSSTAKTATAASRREKNDTVVDSADNSGGDDERQSAGAPPQPCPQQFLDVKVIERPSTASTINASDCPSVEWTTTHQRSSSDDTAASSPLKNNADNNKKKTTSSRTGSIVVTNAHPLLTVAALTEPFLHYYSSAKGKGRGGVGGKDETLVDRHQRLMLVECTPQIRLVGDVGKHAPPTAAADTLIQSPFDFFVPFPNTDSRLYDNLRVQFEGSPLPPFLSKVANVTVGLRFRIVSSHTFVNQPTLTSLSPMPSATSPYRQAAKDDDDDGTTVLLSTGIIAVTSSTLPKNEVSSSSSSFAGSSSNTNKTPPADAKEMLGHFQKKMLLMGYTLETTVTTMSQNNGKDSSTTKSTLTSSSSSLPKPTAMVLLQELIVNNGKHAVSSNWLAYAGGGGGGGESKEGGGGGNDDNKSRLLCPNGSGDDSSTDQQRGGVGVGGGGAQSILRAEQSQSAREYYAKAASSGWSKFGSMLGLGGGGDKSGSEATSTLANNNVLLDSDGNFVTQQQPSSSRYVIPPPGVITICDLSVCGVLSAAARREEDDGSEEDDHHGDKDGQTRASTTSTKTMLVGGYHHNFASFSAHSHAIQCLAFDDSGTMLATASVNGTSVNVYQVMPARLRGGNAIRCGGYDHHSIPMTAPEQHASSAASGKRRSYKQQDSQPESRLGRFADLTRHEDENDGDGDDDQKKRREKKKSGGSAAGVIYYYDSSDDEDEEKARKNTKKKKIKRRIAKTTPIVTSDQSAFVGEITLLYRLLRGTTSAVITNLCFSPLSVAIGVSTSVGTTHFYHLADNHAVTHESSEQLGYFVKNVATSSGGATDASGTTNNSGGGQNAAVSSFNFNNNNSQLSLLGNKNANGNSNSGGGQSKGGGMPMAAVSNQQTDHPFSCFKVGIRGELASVRSAPMSDPICRLRSATTNPPPWPLLAFRSLPLYRLRAAVTVVAERSREVNPNAIGLNNTDINAAATATAAITRGNAVPGDKGGRMASPSPSQPPPPPSAIFDAVMLIPSSLTVVAVQFDSKGHAIVLYSASLSDFCGPRWVNGLTRHQNEHQQQGASPLHSSQHLLYEEVEFVRPDDVARMLQQERQCAHAVDYSWAHVGNFTHSIRFNPNNPNAPPPSFNHQHTVVYRPEIYPAAATASKSNTAPPTNTAATSIAAQRQRFSNFFSQNDDVEEDALFAAIAEEEEWNMATNPYVNNPDEDEDFINEDDFVIA